MGFGGLKTLHSLKNEFLVLRKDVGTKSCSVVRDDGIGHTERPFVKQAAASLRSILGDRGVDETQIAGGSVVIVAGVEYSAAVVRGFVARYGTVLDGENALVKHAPSPAGRVFRDGAVGDAEVTGGNVLAVIVGRAAMVECAAARTLVARNGAVGDCDSTGVIRYSAAGGGRVFRDGAVGDGESAGVELIARNTTGIEVAVKIIAIEETVGSSGQRTVRDRSALDKDEAAVRYATAVAGIVT